MFTVVRTATTLSLDDGGVSLMRTSLRIGSEYRVKPQADAIQPVRRRGFS